MFCVITPGLAQPWVQDLSPEAVLADQSEDPRLTARRQAVNEEGEALARARAEVAERAESLPQLIADLTTAQVSEAMAEQARLDAEAAALRLENTQVEITNTQRRLRDLGEAVREMEARVQLLRNPAKAEADPATRAEELRRVLSSLQQLRTEQSLEQRHLANLNQRLDLARQRLALAERWRSEVETAYRRAQEQARRQAQETLEQRLLQEQKDYLVEAEDLRRELDQRWDRLSEAQRRLLETRVELADAGAKLIDMDLRLASLSNDLSRLSELADRADPTPKTLQQGLTELAELRGELLATQSLLERSEELGERQTQVIQRRDSLGGEDRRAAAQEAQAIEALVAQVQDRQERVQSQLARADVIGQKLEQVYQRILDRNLSSRRTLPDSMAGWTRLAEGIVNAPWTLAYQVRLSVQTAVSTLVDVSALRWLGLAAVELLLLWLVWWGRRVLSRTIQRAKAMDERVSFFGNLSLVLLTLLRRNVLALGLSAALLLALWVAQVPQPGFGIIATLVLLYLGIKAPITLSRLLISSSRVPPEHRHPRLHREIALALFAGGLIAAMTILAHLSSLEPPVIDAFERLFMLYLLVITVPVLRLRAFLHDRLAERFGAHHWFLVARFLLLLLPLSFAVTGLLGVVGYVELAWTIAWHLVVAVAVLVAWLVVRGLINDLVVLLKNYAVTHSGYGLLWTQEVISPLHRILEVGLFILAWVALFQAYGWEGDSAVVTRVWAVLERPLFTLGGADISLYRILITIVSILVVFWLAQWSRAVTYRWVFSRIVDLGVRHSLSVFLQYAIVLVGFLVILRAIGLDLTTLTVFAGAVGVGIGFGLQAISNNFISGLILLIERPLKSGDIVRIGTNDGTVTRIGIRSLTMETFDKLEVIIPNSDVITNAFTNWTHTDNTIRTVLMVRVTYDTEPAKVQRLMERIVHTHAAVLGDPEPLVLIWEYGDTCMMFRVQYFTDVMRYNILEVRSEILGLIWEDLRKNGVRIPVARQELYIKEWPEQGKPSPESVRQPMQDNPQIDGSKPLLTL